MKKLTVVIANYNSRDYLEKCLESLYQETKKTDYQVVVVDNASRDSDFSSLENRHSNLHFLLNETNLGFATACNQGIRFLSAEFYLLLNPDCQILDGAIDKSLKFLEAHPEVGIVGCRVNNPDGSLQLACRRTIPRPSTALYRLLKLSFLFPASKRFGRYNLTYLDEGRTHEVEAVSGSFLMFPNALLDAIGYLDESFFLYGEDLDFCYRAFLKGWKVYYYPEAEIIHHKGRSSRRDAGRGRRHFYDAMEIFYRKHYYTQASFFQKLLVLAGLRVMRVIGG
ncbi:glycosyltransferase family 2 protein [Acidobacteria bacterium AH-259-O06]|nr:glycosyltransferase family 2 protein [Acidobacteria bacterium AH-259-O06]